MKYVFDTDTLADFTNDYGSTRDKVNELLDDGNILALCAISVSELYSGLHPDERERWEAFFTSFPYWEITNEVAIRAGIDRYTFARKGKTIATTDALIGALAREHGATVLTSNMKDYPMPDVSTLSLREA